MIVSFALISHLWILHISVWGSYQVEDRFARWRRTLHHFHSHFWGLHGTWDVSFLDSVLFCYNYPLICSILKIFWNLFDNSTVKACICHISVIFRVNVLNSNSSMRDELPSLQLQGKGVSGGSSAGQISPLPYLPLCCVYSTLLLVQCNILSLKSPKKHPKTWWCASAVVVIMASNVQCHSWFCFPVCSSPSNTSLEAPSLVFAGLGHDCLKLFLCLFWLWCGDEVLQKVTFWLLWENWVTNLLMVTLRMAHTASACFLWKGRSVWVIQNNCVLWLVPVQGWICKDLC